MLPLTIVATAGLLLVSVIGVEDVLEEVTVGVKSTELNGFDPNELKVSTGVVTAAGSYHELAVAAGLGIDPDGAIATGGLGSGGLIADGVLVAYVAGDGAADGVDFLERARKKGNAAGALGHGFESALGSALSLFAEHSDGVNRGSILFLQPAHRLFQ